MNGVCEDDAKLRGAGVPVLTVVQTHTPPAQGWGGALMSASATAATFRQLGIGTIIVASNGNRRGRPVTAAAAEAATGVPTRLFQTHRAVALGFGLHAIPLLWSAIRNSQATYASGVFTWPVTLAALFSLLLGKPYAICPHGGLLGRHLEEIRRGKPIKHLLFKLLVAPLARHARVIRVASRLEQHDILERFPNARVHLAPNAFNIEAIPFSPHRTSGSGRRIIFVGRLAEDKGIVRFAKIWQRIAKADDHLAIVGSGFGRYADRLGTLAADDSRITLLGEQGRAAVYAEMAASDCLALPSGIEGALRENFGNVVVEALAVGRPILATRGLAWDHLPGLGLGLTFEPNDSSIGTAIEAALTEAWLNADDLPRRCRDFATREFHTLSVARDLRTLAAELGVCAS